MTVKTVCKLSHDGREPSSSPWKNGPTLAVRGMWKKLQFETGGHGVVNDKDGEDDDQGEEVARE